MATKRSFHYPTFTPTATADTTALANSTYMCIGASAAAAGLSVLEIQLGGQATTSSLNFMQFARDVVLSGTPATLVTPISDGSLDSRTTATQAQQGSITNTLAGTPPQRSSAITAARLCLTFNPWGGVVRWVAAPGEEWGITGVTVNISESSLSAFTGGSVGAIGAHIIYECI